MQADPLALARAHPELSASRPVSRGQKIFITAACLLVIAASAWNPGCVARTFVAFSTLFYLVFTLYKLLLLRLSLTHDPGIRPSRPLAAIFTRVAQKPWIFAGTDTRRKLLPETRQYAVFCINNEIWALAPKMLEFAL